MIFTLHGQVTLYSNILSDVRIAREAGYSALELHTDKLLRYLDSGGSAEALNTALKSNGIRAAAIDIIGGIEASGKIERQQVMEMTRRLVDTASAIHAPTIQVNAFCGLDGMSIDDNIRIIASNLREIADIGKARGIRFQIEAAAWTPIHTLTDCLQLIDACGRDNIGLVIDFWHFWAGRGAGPEDIAKLDADSIYGVHVSDGYRPDEGKPWVDERQLRGVLPGDGDVPVQEWADAVKATGFNGFVSGEFLNPLLWERDHVEVAAAMRLAMESLFL